METNTGIDYHAVLADLKAQREKLDAAIAGIETMLGMQASSGAAQVGASKLAAPTEIKSDTFFGMSIVNAAEKYLNMVKAPKANPEIAAALEKGGLHNTSGNFANTVGSVIARNADTD